MLKNNKSLGQHWLKNREILNEIAAFAKGKSETCLEIGPGLGTLTSSLLRQFKKVVAVEFDENLANNLPKSFPGKNLEVINADFLKFDLSKMPQPYAVAGNIPYYITSPIIEKLLTAENRPEVIVLLIQKEVAERIADSRQTMLSLFVQNRAEVALGPVVKKDEFTPPPKVDSQIIILAPKDPDISDEVFSLIKLGFIAPRKKLAANLSHLKPKAEILAAFNKLGISPDVRPSDLSLSDWDKLFKAI